MLFSLHYLHKEPLWNNNKKYALSFLIETASIHYILDMLTDYLHLLEDWKVRYAPKTPEEALDDRFVEACQMHCPIEYMADVLTVGDLEERVALVDELMKEGKITFLQEYITRKKKEVAHHGEEPENA